MCIRGKMGGLGKKKNGRVRIDPIQRFVLLKGEGCV